jgi:hypothetical protein
MLWREVQTGPVALGGGVGKLNTGGRCEVIVMCLFLAVSITIYIYIYMDLRLATLKAVSFYLLHNVSTLNQCRKLSCVTVVCKHFASYQGYPNYRWNLIRYAKG